MISKTDLFQKVACICLAPSQNTKFCHLKCRSLSGVMQQRVFKRACPLAINLTKITLASAASHVQVNLGKQKHCSFAFMPFHVDLSHSEDDRVGLCQKAILHFRTLLKGVQTLK